MGNCLKLERFYCHNRACKQPFNGQIVQESGKVGKLYCPFELPEWRKSVTKTASIFCPTTLV